jgi:hypothetical protein
MVVRCIIVSVLALALGCAHQQGSVKNKKAGPSHITISGGSGDSQEEAIVISGAEKQSEGVDAEYRHLSTIHGVKDKNWKIDGQTMVRDSDAKKVYDVVEISLIPSGEKRIYYFDVTGFPWKRKGIGN